jgi:hypothetical protein
MFNELRPRLLLILAAAATGAGAIAERGAAPLT